MMVLKHLHSLACLLGWFPDVLSSKCFDWASADCSSAHLLHRFQRRLPLVVAGPAAAARGGLAEPRVPLPFMPW